MKSHALSIASQQRSVYLVTLQLKILGLESRLLMQAFLFPSNICALSQEMLRAPAPSCHQLPQEGVRPHLQHPPQEEAEVDLVQVNFFLVINSGVVPKPQCSGTLSPLFSEK